MSPPVSIGVLDSGVGGLSVVLEIRERLPGAHIGYVADSAHAPYGPLPEAKIRERCDLAADFLLGQGARLLVVACNTATAAAVPALRERLAAPVVGMQPAVKPATAATKSNIVGVMATTGTLKSARFAALLERFAEGIQVLTQPCPGLVEQVEAGDLDGPDTRALVSTYVTPLVQAGADTLILGCTHFPFLRPVVEATAGDDVAVIDTGGAVARQVARHWREGGHERPGGQLTVWTTGDLDVARQVVPGLLGTGVSVAGIHALPGGGN